MSDTPAMSLKGRPLPTFQSTARTALGNPQLRRNLHKATSTIRTIRGARSVTSTAFW